jgi:apolipoprotein N-acyltransferase
VVKGKKHNSNNILETEKSSITVGLCFEELKIRSFNGDSDFIISSVNNQFFDDTTGLELVSQFSRLIAAENKKYLVRSSNTGITQIVDPYGKVINQIDPNQEKILIENIYI